MSQQKERVIQPKGKDFWGPPIWNMIHILSASYKGDKNLLKFYNLLTKILPCEYCKENLISKIKKYPPEKYFVSRESAFLYSFIIHDLANQHITNNSKYTKYSPNYDEIKNYYFDGIGVYNSDFWFPYIWKSMFVLAATITPENAGYFKQFLEVVTTLLPSKEYGNLISTFLKDNKVDYYLRNNNDSFFYIFMLYDTINKQIDDKQRNKQKYTSPQYVNIKNFYFSSLGKECSDCQLKF